MGTLNQHYFTSYFTIVVWCNPNVTTEKKESFKSILVDCYYVHRPAFRDSLGFQDFARFPVRVYCITSIARKHTKSSIHLNDRAVDTTMTRQTLLLYCISRMAHFFSEDFYITSEEIIPFILFTLTGI